MNADRIDTGAIGAEGAELARYSAAGLDRVLMAWSRPDGIEVTDRPAAGRARAYLVDRGFRCGEQLASFLGDYLSQARLLDACPMQGIEAILAETESEALAPLLGEGGLR